MCAHLQGLIEGLCGEIRENVFKYRLAILEFEKPAILVAGSSCAFLPCALYDEATRLEVEGRWKGRAPTAPSILVCMDARGSRCGVALGARGETRSHTAAVCRAAGGTTRRRAGQSFRPGRRP